MVRAAMALLVGLSACGGKVVFVEEDGGGNGEGGSSSSSPSQGGSSSTTPPTTPATSTGVSTGGATTISCTSLDCAVGQTFCSCLGECSICQSDFCSGGTAEQVCNVDGQGLACRCFFAGALVGECAQAEVDCGLETGCCLGLFQSALQR